MSARISCRFFAAFVAGAAFSSAQDLAAKMDEYLNAHLKLQRFMGWCWWQRLAPFCSKRATAKPNVELDVPNTPASKFRLGSLTKEFTATAIRQLQDQSELSVTDPVCKYVENCLDAWKAITIHHLLRHTSGIPSYTGDRSIPPRC